MKMDNHHLDDPRLFKEFDQSGMLTHLHEMPHLCQRAWDLIMDFTQPPGYESVNKVIILGMGGSAIGGDLAASLALAESKIPVMVSRGYQLPAFTDADTLVIASSYSGNTEEILTAFGEALKTAAKKMVMTTGGKLKSQAEESGIPVFSFDYKAPPRAALPFSLMPIIGILQKLGIISDKTADLKETIAVLNQISPLINEAAPFADNPAKQMAAGLKGNLAVVYGAGIVSEVARRWKTQFNENSKAWAFYELLPELNHNAILGYRFPRELAAKISVIFLNSNLLPERVKLRYRLTRQLLNEAGVNTCQSDGQGESPLSQIMSLVLSGDYVSYYLALLNQIDPSPVKEIDFLKKQLKKND